jgi:isopentenyl-diphosphate delta-isomerase
MVKREKENIVIVDENDDIIGEEDKEKCHDGPGILHRGFLAMVFNNAGELLLTRRSDRKRLWPGFWDGTVASHVFRGEDYEQASKRRLLEEIGLTTDDIQYSFKFRYKVGYENVGTEHEICAVTVVRGVDINSIFPDNNEISEVRFIDPKVLIEEVRGKEHTFTPWLILAIEHMSKRPIA